ncbi:conserved hypothetical protein [Perkinsus marinus ATCC 50983]|uniref:Uncharacterized protein n=1 Tax=Perkinsus marinus (strain ATCC 50983 / TXsc) TaxID=423536 RepID=C5LK75_PERM5|nr:conserved hypothetical protein [Perkinsus marinus ATCC 50983]EER02862.1 conserved hypothetical protein [Perkinsus marinus ATCC 50983]|eukprot:XP_002771046.1 conserved hypothetical protein [Perkinsus marinus ATCC 50983]
MFLPPQERLAALKRREAELEAAKVTETSERPRKERKARKPSEKGKGKAKETANTTEDAEEEERKLVTQEREAEVSPEATEETVIEEEGGLLGETMGKSPPPEKKTVPLAPIFAPKSERLRMAAEKKLAEEKGAVEETRGGRKRRVSRVGLQQGSHRLSNDPVGQVARAKPKARNKPRRSPESESEYSTSEAESVLPPPPPPKVVLTEYSAAPLKVAGSSKSTGPVFGIFSGRSSGRRDAQNLV